MNITLTNKRAIHDVLIKDLSDRLFKDYNSIEDDAFAANDEDYDRVISAMVNQVLNCNNMRDVNELLTEYCDLFTSYDELTVPTIDGTLNYVIGLLINQCGTTIPANLVPNEYNSK